MRFLLILADVETEQLGPGDPGFQEKMAEYQDFTEKVQKLGAFLDAGKLQPSSRARTVRVRDGEVLTTDGPFVETKEQFGGFYLLDCRDLAQALELAALLPTARDGSVEVRPLLN